MYAFLGPTQRAESLRHYATWSTDDLSEFEEAVALQRIVDEDLWR